jgi:hypothetical protein
MRRTTSAAPGNGLGTTIKYLRGAAGIVLGTTIKYLRHKTRQRPWHHDQLPATHNERFRGKQHGHHDQVTAMHNERRHGQRPELMPVIFDVPIYHKGPYLPFYVRASVVANKQNSITEVRGLGSQCVWIPSFLAVFYICQIGFLTHTAVYTAKIGMTP